MNILIVDAERESLELCAIVAQHLGMKATRALSAEEAVEALTATAVDFLLIDLALEGTGGMDLLRHVRESHREVPVMVLTQVRDGGAGDRSDAAGRNRLPDQATASGRAGGAAGSGSASGGAATGESPAARAIANEAGVRRNHRGLRADAAGVQGDPESEPARISGADPGRERHREGTGCAQHPFFRGSQGSRYSRRWIALRWCPR